MTGTDWVAWHRQYDAEGPLTRRLEAVQAHIGEALEATPGPLTILSLCAGDARDIVGAIEQAGVDASRIRGRLIELDPSLAAGARQRVHDAGLSGLEVIEANAGDAAQFEDAVPADLVLLCGIFGNVTDADIRRTVTAMPSVCAPGATVIWTRHRREPDLTPAIRGWFEGAGFSHVAFDSISDSASGVGVERFEGSPAAYEPGLRLFTFRETTGNWLSDLESDAPDVVAAFRGIETGKFIGVRREVRRRAAPGSAPAIVRQLAATADAFDGLLSRLRDHAFVEPGGERDWNIAQAIGHAAHARAGLALAAALAASGRWPKDAPAVVPGVAGQATASRDELRGKLAVSQRSIERSARSIEGHETDPCPLEHPLVGRLRCGEWLLFAGVHDLMHLEQLHAIEAHPARSEPG